MNIFNRLKRLEDPAFRSLLDSRYGIGRLERLIFSNWFNPICTLWINFRSFPLKYAILCPIWVYGHPRFYSLCGYFKLNCKPESGLLKINVVSPGAPSNMGRQSEIYNNGIIVINGRCKIGTGNKIIATNKAIIDIGRDVMIMDNCTIASHKKTIIGEGTIIAHNTQIMDTNFHFIANLNTKQIPKRTADVSIGKYCWICNSSSIMMGSKIPNYSIVGSHSVVNKKFPESEECCMIAGTPAKIIKKNYIRVFNSDVERKIWKYWEKEDSETFPINDLSIDEMV